MNEVWNLDRIYTGFDDIAFSKDFETLKKQVDDYAVFTSSLSDAEPLQGLEQGIAYEEEITRLASKLAGYASLRQAANTRDTEAGSQMGRIMSVLSGVATPQATFHSWAAKLPNLPELVKNAPSLRDYEFLFADIADSSRYLLPGKGEEIMARMRMSGGDAWGDLQSYLTSTVPVTYRGEQTNLSSIRNLAYDADPKVRKDAYEAEIACYDRIKDSIAFALNSIKLQTISECKLRGYESPLARTLKHSFMKKETLDAMLEAMDEYSPKFWQYLKAKGKALGHENGLPWYDLFAPMGSSSTKFTAQQAKDFLVEQFASFNPEEADMIAEAFDHEWIDFYPRDGKTGGAFCAGVECLGESRILTNFDGMFTDVVTLAHELGQRWCTHLGMRNQQVDVQGTPCVAFG